MCMRVCYLDWHEAGLCCYLVIHIENPLQLFYFYLCPIYWLSLVCLLCILLSCLYQQWHYIHHAVEYTKAVREAVSIILLLLVGWD
jgi:hypothetical protein